MFVRYAGTGRITQGTNLRTQSEKAEFSGAGLIILLWQPIQQKRSLFRAQVHWVYGAV